MCANFAQLAKIEKLEALLGRKIKGPESLLKSRLVFPAKPAMIVHSEQLELDEMIWGFPAPGSIDMDYLRKYSTFNARVESVDSLRTFKKAWAENQRCVIPADYFVEWNGPQGAKRKVLVKDAENEPTMLAGLWTKPKADGPLFFTMLTTEPNEQIRPVIAEKERVRVPIPLLDWKGWLNADLTPDEAKDFCGPFQGKFSIEVKDGSK